jgi:hypothetical protein
MIEIIVQQKNIYVRYLIKTMIQIDIGNKMI